MKYAKAEILKRTVFAALWGALSPVALLGVGQIIGTNFRTRSRILAKLYF